MKKKILWIIGSYFAIVSIVWGAAVIGYQDWQKISTPGSNPASGFLRTYADTTNSYFKCLTSGGAACYFMGATENSAVSYVAGGGAANAQTATYAPAVIALVNGLRLCWLPTAANSTTTPTFAPNGLTAKTITKNGTGALSANDLTTTAIACAFYDGTEWQLQNPQTTASVSGVSSVTGDGALISNSLSTGAITLTLGTATAHKWWGNNTGSTATPGYQTIGAADLPTALSSSTSVNGTSIPSGGALTQTIANGTSSMGTSAIASGVCATVVTTSATGTATTDDITADFNADPTAVTGYSPTSSGMLTIIKYPTLNNVNFKVCNNTASSITPGAITLNWRVTR